MRLEYTKNAKMVISFAKEASETLGQGTVGTEHILIGCLWEGEGLAAKVLKENGVGQEAVENLLSQTAMPEPFLKEGEGPDYTPKAATILENSEMEAWHYGATRIGTEHILLALLREKDSVAIRLLGSMNINVHKMFVDILQTIGLTPNEVKAEFNAYKNGGKTGKNGKPSMLDQFSTDLTYAAEEGRLDPVIGREKEISRVMQILSRRTKNNPCLVGEPGVGKTAIVESIAQMIVRDEVPSMLRGKRLLTIDLPGMVAGSKYRGEFEERIKRFLHEVMEEGNILLFMDEIHTLIGAGGAEGAIDAANILKPFLARGEIQFIGATTREEYRKHIEKDAALERRFQPVEVKEPTIEEAIEILEGIKGRFEEHHGVTFTKEAIQAAASMSKRYVSDRFLPDKAIDVIDETASRKKIDLYKAPEQLKKLEQELKEAVDMTETFLMKGKYKKASEYKNLADKKEMAYERAKAKWEKNQTRSKLVIDEEDVAEVISIWTGIPLNQLNKTEADRLRNLESILHERVIGQEEAVDAVSKAVRRGRVGLKDPKRPIGSFLFLGPTGVGKTELSKALAEAVYGSENNMIRIDMTEYMEKHSVSKLIGSPPGYVGFEEGGQLSEKVRRNPYSVILFDEIEKAHGDVFNILLQVLDDGIITDSTGRQIDFKNTIIIMTSNAGAQRIMAPKLLGFATEVDEKKNHEHMKSGVMEEVRRLFKPEFLNRIDATIVFHALNEEHMKDILRLLGDSFAKRIKKQMNLTIHFTEEAYDLILRKGKDEKFGARPLKRALQNMMEDPLCDAILSGEVAAGGEIYVKVSEEKLIFSVEK